MSYFVNNRQLIKSLKVDTSNTDTPSYVDLCCATDRTINFDMDTQDFSVFCDALKRHVTTGANITIETTIKVDAQNTGVIKLFSNLHSLIASGTIAQFNNIKIRFELLSGYTTDTLTYTTYDAYANLAIDSLGGAAEDVGEFSASFTLNGTATAASL